MSGVLDDRAALITGASHGLGLEIARLFVREGASVCICGRDETALARARDELLPLAGGRVVSALTADVSDPTSVKDLVQRALAELPDLSILINNAGIYGPKGSVWEVNWDDWVQALHINLLGSVLVAREIIPQLRARGGGKIVQLSGGGATSPLPGLSAYAVSKAGIVRFVETLALELAGDHVDVNAIAPGALNTRMLHEVIEAGPRRVGAAFHERALKQQAEGGTPLAKGAELAAWLASEASDGITGKLLSAVWDPYRNFNEHRADLDSDIYTLRRIVPGDRGMAWGDG